MTETRSNNFGSMLVIDLDKDREHPAITKYGRGPALAKFLCRDQYGTWYWTSDHPMRSPSYSFELAGQ